MSQLSPTLKVETVAEVVQTESGALVLRARAGRRLALTGFARTARLADGSYALTPVAQEVEMGEAIKITGMPYTTLRRVIDLEVLKAFKRSPGRWVVDLESLLQFKEASRDPEFWDNLKGPETGLQGDLKLD